MTGIETAMLVAGLASAAISAAGSIAAGQAEANAAEYNAEMAQQQAERERQIADRDAVAYRRQNSRALATSRARRAGSGVTSRGSPLLVDEATAAEIELGAQNILSGGAANAYGYQQQAALSRSRSSNARTSGFLTAGSTLLTAASTLDYGP
jgi:secreted protein with Ig-like and vWFA domain